MFGDGQMSLFVDPPGHTRGFLTCPCGTKSPIILIPTGRLPEDQWTTWARGYLKWRVDCPACDPPDQPLSPERAARAIPPVLRVEEY
jgi:hypothetical protein